MVRFVVKQGEGAKRKYWTDQQTHELKKLVVAVCDRLSVMDRVSTLGRGVALETIRIA